MKIMNYFFQDKQQQYVVTEDYAAGNPDQLSVHSGQKVELLQDNEHHHEGLVRVSLVEQHNSNNNCVNRTGLIPRQIISLVVQHSTECGGRKESELIN